MALDLSAQHFDFHFRHINAGRAFAAAGLAGDAMFHGLMPFRAMSRASSPELT